MKIIDGRVVRSGKLRKENTEKVRKFFLDNPNSSKTECQRSENLCYATVIRALRDITKEGKGE